MLRPSLLLLITAQLLSASASAQTTWNAWGPDDDGDSGGEQSPPPPPPPREEPDEPPDLTERQTESWAFGFDVGVSPVDDHPLHATVGVTFMVFPKADHRESERKVHLGSVIHLYVGTAASRILQLDGEQRWGVPLIGGADASLAFMGNRGLYFRTGIDLRIQVRRLPARIYLSPQMALGISGDNLSVELGIAYEPYIVQRTRDSMGSAWDVAERTWMTFLRMHFAPNDL